MSRAVGNWSDRERPVPHGEDDMDETTNREDLAERATRLLGPDPAPDGGTLLADLRRALDEVERLTQEARGARFAMEHMRNMILGGARLGAIHAKLVEQVGRWKATP